MVQRLYQEGLIYRKTWSRRSEVPPEAVKEVIFGSKISTDTQEQVEQALQARAPHVLRKRVTFVPSDGLRVVDC